MFIFKDHYHYFESSLLKDLGVKSGFGTKKTPPIDECIKASNYISMLQVHSSDIVIIDSSPAERISRVDNIDGMITRLPDVALLLKTADCVPALYYDPVAECVAVSHQGWRGTLANMALVAIEKLVSCGCKVENIRVALGPSLQDCCNRLYDKRYDDFKEAFPGWFEKFTKVEGENTYISLAKLNVLQYVSAGIHEKNIDVHVDCTRCEEEIYYSYDRNDYDVTNPRMRNWSFIMR